MQKHRLFFTANGTCSSSLTKTLSKNRKKWFCFVKITKTNHLQKKIEEKKSNFFLSKKKSKNFFLLVGVIFFNHNFTFYRCFQHITGFFSVSSSGKEEIRRIFFFSKKKYCKNRTDRISDIILQFSIFITKKKNSGLCRLDENGSQGQNSHF